MTVHLPIELIQRTHVFIVCAIVPYSLADQLIKSMKSFIDLAGITGKALISLVPRLSFFTRREAGKKKEEPATHWTKLHRTLQDILVIINGRGEL